MANQYRSVLASGGASTGGDALPAEVLSGKTFTNDNGAQTGTMTNNGAVTQTLSAGQSYTIPEGYHNGSGTVTASSDYPTTTTEADYTLAASATITSLNIDVSDGKSYVLAVRGSEGITAPIICLIVNGQVITQMSGYSITIVNGIINGASVSSGSSTNLRLYKLV